MADTTQANVLAIAPELADVSQDAWDIVLADAALMITAAAWGEKQEMAQRYLVAHKLAVIAKSSSGGTVVSEKVGDVSTTYAAGDASADGLSETKYGREFKRLKKSTISGFMMVTP